MARFVNKLWLLIVLIQMLVELVRATATPMDVDSDSGASSLLQRGAEVVGAVVVSGVVGRVAAAAVSAIRGKVSSQLGGLGAGARAGHITSPQGGA